MSETPQVLAHVLSPTTCMCKQVLARTSRTSHHWAGRLGVERLVQLSSPLTLCLAAYQEATSMWHNRHVCPDD